MHRPKFRSLFPSASTPNSQARLIAQNVIEQIMDIIRQRQVSFGVFSGDDNLTIPLIAAGAL